MYSLEHYENIISAFEGLLSALNSLCLHIHDDIRSFPVSIADNEGLFISDRDRVIYALKQFEPNVDLSPQETEPFPGAVGCTQKTFQLIDTVNAKKDALKLSAQAYKKKFKANPTKPVRDILLKNGFGSLRLKQVYRHIHYVNDHPERIAWTKVKAYMNIVITVQEAQEALLKAGQGEHIDIQLAKLSMLRQNTKLVKRREIKPCCAVNLTSHDTNGKAHHQKITTALPVFYLFDADKEAPTVCFSEKATRGAGSTRSDKKSEDQPFLKSINVYRYKDDIG
jgi:hypothetical protein